MKNKKKILIFIDWFLPGYKAGGPIRSIANLIEHLKQFFDFYIITRNTDYLESKPYSNIQSNEWINFSDGVKVFYVSNKNVNKKILTKITHELDFDIVYINGIYSFYFSILPIFIVKKLSKKIIVSSRGMLSQQAFSRKKFKKSVFVFLSKLFNLYKYITFHVTSSVEFTDVSALFKKNEILEIANLPRKLNESVFLTRIKNPGTLHLASIARISQEKNTKFALEILTQLNEGNVHFDIYGSIYDKDYWNECQKIINSFPENIKVEYKGTVDTGGVVETFAKYHFSFMPSVAENYGHSILESFIAGTPVITSSNTPWKKLEEQKIGWDLSVDNKQKFVEILKKCISMSNDEYSVLSKNSFLFAQNVLNNNNLVDQYLKMFDYEQ